MIYLEKLDGRKLPTRLHFEATDEHGERWQLTFYPRWGQAYTGGPFISMQEDASIEPLRKAGFTT